MFVVLNSSWVFDVIVVGDVGVGSSGGYIANISDGNLLFLIDNLAFIGYIVYANRVLCVVLAPAKPCYDTHQKHRKYIHVNYNQNEPF